MVKQWMVLNHFEMHTAGTGAPMFSITTALPEQKPSSASWTPPSCVSPPAVLAPLLWDTHCWEWFTHLI